MSLAVIIAAGGAWVFGPGDVGDQDRVVLTRQPPPPLQTPVFSGVLREFGDSDASRTSLAAAGSMIAPVNRIERVAAIEVPMTESRFRMVMQLDIGRMKAAGIGMDAQDAEMPEEVTPENMDRSERLLLP